MSPGALDPAARGRALERMRGEVFDVLVVGGGITGAGIALDAATRGLSVALVEARDIASGTSSRSSKLIHGGLRYLEMLDLGLVREALRERRLLLTRLAPHLVRPVPFLFPLRHRGWERPYMGAGLLLYDSMGGARHVPRARHLSRAAALRSAPALRPDSLVGAVRFHDAQEDDALFAVYVARTAAAHGAAIATRAAVTAFLRSRSGRVLGAQVRDGVSGSAFELRARHTLAAVGVGTDRVLELATGRPHHELRPSKGVHLLVPRACIPMRTGLFMRTEKSIFHAIPWGAGHWLLGDTDTPWDGDSEAPVANRSDVEYVLAKVNSVLRRPIAVAEVCGAGSVTCRLTHVYPDGAAPYFTVLALGKEPEQLAQWEAIKAAAADRTLQRPIAGAEAYLAAEAVHACTHQGALDLDDILARRLRVSIEVPDRGRAAAAAVAPLVAPVLGWSEERTAEEVDRYVRLRDAEAAAEAAPDDATGRRRYEDVIRRR